MGRIYSSNDPITQIARIARTDKQIDSRWWITETGFPCAFQIWLGLSAYSLATHFAFDCVGEDDIACQFTEPKGVELESIGSVHKNPHLARSVHDIACSSRKDARRCSRVVRRAICSSHGACQNNHGACRNRHVACCSRWNRSRHGSGLDCGCMTSN